MDKKTEIFDFYENGAEIGRLERGLGVIEAARTKELLSRFIKPGMTVYDVGGGIGYYSDWLARKGCTVSLYELAPSAVRYAREHQTVPYYAAAADARSLPVGDGSCDALLLMGPLYHLIDKEDRLKALSEAWSACARAACLSQRVSLSSALLPGPSPCTVPPTTLLTTRSIWTCFGASLLEEDTIGRKNTPISLPKRTSTRRRPFLQNLQRLDSMWMNCWLWRG